MDTEYNCMITLVSGDAQDVKSSYQNTADLFNTALNVGGMRQFTRTDDRVILINPENIEAIIPLPEGEDR